MKQALVLAALGSVYALAALFDAPIVSRVGNWCAVGLVSYSGPGWFAVSSATFAAMLLGAALYLVLRQASIPAPPLGGVESIAPAPKNQPMLYVFLDEYPDLPPLSSTGLLPAVAGSG